MEESNIREKLREWKNDPVKMVWDLFGATPDPWQRDALQAFPGCQRLGMKACKGPGKTTQLSWLTINFLLTRKFANIAALSITSDNLRDGFWKEMAKWIYQSPLLKDQFRITKTRIFHKDFPETWWLSARSFAKQGDAMQQADALAGLHSDYMMCVLDEAGGIPSAIMATAEAVLSTGIECKIVMAGNPTHLDGPLYAAMTNEAHLWHMIEITGDPDDPNRSPRIDKQWARDQIEKYGRDNPWVLVNVFGKFPPASLNVLLGPEEIGAAFTRKPDQDAVSSAQTRIGVDVARFGDDRTVIFKRQGQMSWEPIVLRNMRTNDIAARVMAEATQPDFECSTIFVDDSGGWGGGVIDSMIQAGWSPIPVNFSGKALDSRYFNKRAEMYFLMAEWVKRGGFLHRTSEMPRELSSSTYSFQNGKFRLEDKNQIKQRLGYSPDIADAIALTFALPEMPSDKPGFPGSSHWSQRATEMKWDYDPYSDERMGK